MTQPSYTDELQYGTQRISFEVDPADREKVRKRARWILRQQRHFAGFVRPIPPKEYVSGETHPYLGRQYRLKVFPIEQDEEESVKLIGAYFRIRTHAREDAEHVKGQLYTWYRAHAEETFSKCMSKACETMRPYEVEQPSWHIRCMKKRWGSYTPSGRVLLNLGLIRAPTVCIDYVILHELCHAKHAHHGSAFYELLSKVMPRWRHAKKRLQHVRF